MTLQLAEEDKPRWIDDIQAPIQKQTRGRYWFLGDHGDFMAMIGSLLVVGQSTIHLVHLLGEWLDGAMIGSGFIDHH